MPKIFGDIDKNYDWLAQIEDWLQDVIKTKDADKMQQLKKTLNELTSEVESSERTVYELEGDITEKFNGYQKLCLRDEELFEIESQLKSIEDYFDAESTRIEKELSKINENGNKSNEGDSKSSRAGMDEYLLEIRGLMEVIRMLKRDRKACYTEFDGDIPLSVKQARILRLKYIAEQLGKKYKGQTKVCSDKPTDIYYMIAINYRYRLRI